jgi:tetratricopeptide (TPR) repeat protein
LADLAFSAAMVQPPLEEMMAIPRREMVGTDGPILETPPQHEAYQACMARLPGLFRNLSAENMAAKGQELIQLEESWPGEYLPELIASVTCLRTHARRNRVRLSGYLSITLLFRHLFLFFHGLHEHAAHLVQDLDLLEERDREGFLRRPVLIWVLLALCRLKRWEEAEQLRRMLPGGLEQQAVAAYTLLARGQAAQAAAMAEAALADAPPLSAFSALLAVVQGRALLDLGRPLEALKPARWVLVGPLTDPVGLAGPLRTNARQVLARAASALNWPEPLYHLYEQDADSRQDPLVVQALAVLTGRAGQREQARCFIRQASALVRGDHSGLSKAIAETARWLERV